MVQVGRDLSKIVDFDPLWAAGFFLCFAKSTRVHGL